MSDDDAKRLIECLDCGREIQGTLAQILKCGWLPKNPTDAASILDGGNFVCDGCRTHDHIDGDPQCQHGNPPCCCYRCYELDVIAESRR